MSYRIEISPDAERSLLALPSSRRLGVRRRLLQHLEEVAGLAALRRYGDEGEPELFPLRLGAYEARYAVDHAARAVTLRELVRESTLHIRSIG
ncbi:hypothetical protein FGE12_26455 [Aggregicoccus sp. 17bor-14]|uniref:hypothetical protein n=1 Tax=Myxococcaceae TaxID=31 RepID=UPI00129CA1A4|nr:MULTISPECIES: hypothetical protein [Myxococcaceae]MBF5045982.1 hypothetical protein [Simulacricoccus sp. 17bor-14]MRI91713.1 hypothetical protein [Aggregicoccus sp. 17bor-14]